MPSEEMQTYQRRREEVATMAVIDGHESDKQWKIIGFRAGKLALYNGETFKPLTLAQAAAELARVHKLQVESGDFTFFDCEAKAKFLRMVAAAVKAN
jgi:hypothetical protein